MATWSTALVRRRVEPGGVLGHHAVGVELLEAGLEAAPHPLHPGAGDAEGVPVEILGDHLVFEDAEQALRVVGVLLGFAVVITSFAEP